MRNLIWGSESLKPLDLLESAWKLTELSDGRPKQADLRRAVSSTYYAMFHALARCCADTLIGSPGSGRSPEAWAQTYRSLEHGYAADQCKNKNVINKFPATVQNFAVLFAAMQAKRIDADYDPTAKFYKSEVQSDIVGAASVIDDFGGAHQRDRTAFAAWVLLRKRKN